MLAESQSQWFIIIALIILTITVLNISRRSRNKGNSPRQYSREIDSATTRSSAVKRDMEALLVELNELARQINAQIDTKFAKLEKSITDADRRIEALRTLIKETRGRQSGDAGAAGHDKDVDRPSLDVVVGDDKPGASPAEPSNASLDSEASEPTTIPEVVHGEDPDTAGNINDQIYELADDGRSPLEIAQELQQSVGEVELILNLRRQRSHPN